jgi:hypothetical protein
MAGSVMANNPKNEIRTLLKKELEKSNFIEQAGVTGDLLVEFSIDDSGKIVIHQSISEHEELIQKFTAFVANINLNLLPKSNEVYAMRFLFRRY